MIPLSWCRWSLLALIAVQLLWFGWLKPPEIVPLSLALALSVLPLLISLALAWTLKPHGLIISGLILLIYFSIGVTEAWAGSELRAIALAQVVLVVVYFTALAMARRRQRQAG